MNYDMSPLDMILVLARFILALIVIYGIAACLLMIWKIIVNGTGEALAIVLRTKLGMAAAIGGVLYVFYLAVAQGWRL